MPTDAVLAQTSNALVYSAMTSYTVAMVAFAASLAAGRGKVAAPEPVAALVGGGGAASPDQPVADTSRRPPGRRAGNVGMALYWLGTVLLALGVLTRGLSAHRLPWGNMYEFSCAAALAVSIVFLAISLRRDVRWLGIFVVVPVLLTLGVAVTLLYSTSGPLVPELHSYWLGIHVTAAILSGGAFCVSGVVTVLYLAVDREERRSTAGKPPGRLNFLVEKVPSADRLDTLGYRIIAFMFPIWTFAVIAGAIWAESAWGRYWGWDPKETWAFITWVIYAGYLHARVTVGWRGRRAAYISLLGFAAFLFNYYGVNLLVTGLHSFAGVG